MTYRHEIMYLNPSRTYLRVDDTWYDAPNSFTYSVGESFLIGRVAEILSYDEYKEKFPESKSEMGPTAMEKTTHMGYVRKVSTGFDSSGTKYSKVEYAVNPKQLVPFDKLEFEVYE